MQTTPRGWSEFPQRRRNKPCRQTLHFFSNQLKIKRSLAVIERECGPSAPRTCIEHGAACGARHETDPRILAPVQREGAAERWSGRNRMLSDPALKHPMHVTRDEMNRARIIRHRRRQIGEVLEPDGIHEADARPERRVV